MCIRDRDKGIERQRSQLALLPSVAQPMLAAVVCTAPGYSRLQNERHSWDRPAVARSRKHRA
eukprot:3770022-Pleurochrysis_carterae.AAC.1